MRRLPARLAVGEALTNMLAADVASLRDVRLSANWMAACGEPGEDAALYATVRGGRRGAVPGARHRDPGRQGFAVDAHGVAGDDGAERAVVAPVSLIVSAFAPVADVRRTLTPQLRHDCGSTVLLLVDLGRGRNRLGASALAQVCGQLGDDAPDLDDPALLVGFAAGLRELRAAGRVLAYHDRSDGGLFATWSRWPSPGTAASSSRCRRSGATRSRSCSARSSARCCRCAPPTLETLRSTFARHGLGDDAVLALGTPDPREQRVRIRIGEQQFDESWEDLRRAWSETS